MLLSMNIFDDIRKLMEWFLLSDTVIHVPIYGREDLLSPVVFIA